MQTPTVILGGLRYRGKAKLLFASIKNVSLFLNYMKYKPAAVFIFHFDKILLCMYIANINNIM